MGLIPPNEKEFDMPEVDDNLRATMEEILNREMFTYYMLGKSEKQNIRRAFVMGFEFARTGYLSRGIR